MSFIDDLHEKRAALVGQMQTIDSKPREDWTDEDVTKYDRALDEIETYDKQIKDEERREAFRKASDKAQKRQERKKVEQPTEAEKEKRYQQALFNAIKAERKNSRPLSEEDRHPNAYAYRTIANLLVEDLELQ